MLDTDHGIEHTEIVSCTKGIENRIEIRSCKGISNVIEFYDCGVGRSMYGNGGARQKIFGFYFQGIGFWFRKKSDAIFAANWVVDSSWNGEGDLEGHLQDAICTKENGWKELGKVFF